MSRARLLLGRFSTFLATLPPWALQLPLISPGRGGGRARDAGVKRDRGNVFFFHEKKTKQQTEKVSQPQVMDMEVPEKKLTVSTT